VTRFIRTLAAVSGVAVAAWLLPASIHIVDWPSSGPSRVALFAPLWTLWLALAVAIVAAAALAWSSSAEKLTPSIDPFALLWVWTVPYLPWLPDRMPVLLALAGPLRWGLAALAVCGCALAVIRLRRPVREAPALPGRRALFAISLAIYLGFGLWSADVVGPTADEPHYLIITQSLLRDHDLAIENNHARGDFREYFGGELRPDFLQRGLNDVIYSIHAPGLPALLVPAYAVAGYRGAVVLLCLFAALAALAVFDLAEMLAGRTTAWITWAAVCLTVPFIPHSWLIFPEMPGTLAMAWAVLWLYAPLPARARTWIWCGLALGMLPWLHTKFVILLAAMAGLLCLRLWRQPKAAAALLAPVAVSGALWLGSFYWMYGVFDPQIPYGDFPKLFVLFANIPRGVLGLLFDQKFGLLAYAPVYLVAIAGCWVMLRRAGQRWFALALLATVLTFVASSTRMYMWWGGSSAPARFLVPVLPLLAPMIAIGFGALRTPVTRGFAALLLGLSLLMSIGGSMFPEQLMLFSPPHGVARIAEALQGGSPLPLQLPTFAQEAMRAPLVALLPWLLACIAALIVMLASRRSRRVSGFQAVCGGVVAFCFVGAAAAATPESSGRRETSLRGRYDLAHAYDGTRQRGFSYARRTRLDARALLDLATFRVSRAAGELSDEAPRVAGPFELPAGRYAARIWFAGDRAREGAVFLSLRNRLQIAQTGEGPLTNPTALAFELPVDAAVWAGVSGPGLLQGLQQVEVVAESVVPRSERPAIDVRALEPIAGRPGAFIVYANGDTYPEGGVFWTRGTREGRVLVATGGASTLVLTLHVGPAGGVVHVTVAGQDRSLTLAPDQTREISVPLSTADRLVPVTVEAPGSFRPADHEPGSTDQRSLGCQVRIALQ
jgi:hypothetical protein